MPVLRNDLRCLSEFCVAAGAIGSCQTRFWQIRSGMKLAQNQVWKRSDEYLRIVHLERLKVRYKSVKDLFAGEGTHHEVSKKEFCRLLKGATLLKESEARDIRMQQPSPDVTHAKVAFHEGEADSGKLPDA